jgi:transcription termination factor Rho
VTAQALEQGVLESKDKSQLIQIAEALGVKANTRLKKADIIDQILAKTGGGAATPEARPAAEPAASPTPAPAPVVPPAEEPKAEWELALEPSGGDESTDGRTNGDRRTSEAKRGDRAPIERGDRRQDDREQGDAERGRTEQDDAEQDEPEQDDAERGDATQAETRQADAKQAEAEQAEAKQAEAKQAEVKRGDARQGDRRPDQQRDGQSRQTQQNDQNDGESRNKRRRRRRKKSREDGPQGEDRDLLDADDEQPAAAGNEPVRVEGYLDIRDEGYGFLRVDNFLASKSDSYIPVKLSRQYGLRKGDHVVGLSRPAGRNEKNPAMLEIHSVNGRPPEDAKRRRRFEDLTALFPDSRLRMEDPSDPANMTARIIDLVSPIGKGQRGIIVSPPKAGKTTVMKTIAASIEKNNPECRLIVLLIDERPEEVTDMRRHVKGEVIASTFDKPSDQHTQIAEMTIEKAKRLVEYGEDVVVILDGITRLSRAYNLAAPASGRILSGGIDAGALYPPKKFFGAARNVEEGGSLTILATALVETNSRMDEAVFEEFKGTGNMELRLDRRLAERRIYPAIDVDASSTRHEELLFDRKQLQMVWKLRRVLSGLAADGNAAPGLELLVDRLKTFRTNDEFLTEIAKQPGM